MELEAGGVEGGEKEEEGVDTGEIGGIGKPLPAIPLPWSSS